MCAGIVRNVLGGSGPDSSFRANFYGKRSKNGLLTVNFRTDAAGTPSCSPDGKWAVFTSVRLGKNTLWKTSIDGGEPERLTDYSSEFPDVSPDGKWIAFSNESEPSKLNLAVVPFQGGQPAESFEVVSGTPAGMYRDVHWSRDGRALTYVDSRKGVSNIWSQSIDGGAPRQVTDFKSGLIFAFAWSPDGKRAALACGTHASDVVMMKDFR